MRRREPARVLGPYEQDQQWRIIVIDAKGRRKSHIADSRQAANRLAAKLRANLDARTVAVTIEEWEAARVRSESAAPATVAEQATRVRAMLGSVLDQRLDEVTERQAAAIYDRTTQVSSKKTGSPLRPATHRFYLWLVQYMWKWAQKQGYAKGNPWADIEPIGRVSAGKPQLRPAEARRFAQVAEREAAAGSGVALAALCCLSLGVRASEALGLTARDVDAEASEVYVNGTKTAAARRRLKVPDYLCNLLARAAATRQPCERLCLARRQTLHAAVIALCARAGVPRVCVHGLRGTHASLAVSGGASVEAVARVLGHTSTKMTLGHYITAEAATGARLTAVESSLNPTQSFRSGFSPKLTDGEIERSFMPSLSLMPRKLDADGKRQRQLRRSIDHLLWACSSVAKARFTTVDQALAWLRHRGCRDQALRLGALRSELMALQGPGRGNQQRGAFMLGEPPTLSLLSRWVDQPSK